MCPFEGLFRLCNPSPGISNGHHYPVIEVAYHGRFGIFELGGGVRAVARIVRSMLYRERGYSTAKNSYWGLAADSCIN